MCFIIKELMIKLSCYVYVDYFIKCPYNSANNEINLQDINLVTIANLTQKTEASYDENVKYEKKRNILSAYMDEKTHKINVIFSNNSEKGNNSIIQIKKDVSHLNFATNDNLALNNRIVLPKNGAKKPKKFKKISFNNINDVNINNSHNKKNIGANIQRSFDDSEENNSKENSHRIDNNYSRDSYDINANSKYKDSKLNTIGKTYHDFNVNEINRMENLNNFGGDNDILGRYKEKQISPSTAATEKSYSNAASSKRIINEADLGRNLSNLK